MKDLQKGLAIAYPEYHSQTAALASGAAGAALFWAYLAESTQRQQDLDRAVELLNAAMEAVACQPMSNSLYGGYLGIAFAAEHIGQRFFDNEEDINEEVDEAIQQTLQTGLPKGDYDLISGIVGLGVYALERLPRPAAVHCLQLIVEQLHQWADSPGGGKSWFTPPELLHPNQQEIAPNGYYNLGLAHGVPGIIGLLAHIVATDALPVSVAESARSLLDETVTWMLGQKLPATADATFTAYLVEGQEPEPARSAWCYGDPGAAAALLAAARGTGNAEWAQEAIDIAKKSVRRPLEDTAVKDAMICHGAAGLGHIYNRFYQASGDSAFAEAARFWLQRTLDMRQPDTGIAGYSHYTIDQNRNPCWIADAGFLTGVAGVGLVLLAAIEPVEPIWDRVLLTLIPSSSIRP